MKKKVLFILKRREDYGQEHYSNEGLTTGLYNSATFVCNMLNANNIDSKIVVVIDNNDIDREVNQYSPTHVIIEGLWVVPEKFEVLKKLHKKVKWIIRIHSNSPFLANEGIAFDWIAKYTNSYSVNIATNAPEMNEELRHYVRRKFALTPIKEENLIHNLSNYYPEDHQPAKNTNFKNNEHINIGCFGAIRPLKNHMIQAISAVKFADDIGKKLRFHINIGRIEQNGLPVYNNLKAYFNNLVDKGHELVEHQWMPREEFLQLCRSMDIGMQVSFSETFNIVAADFINQGVPVVTSREIPWVNGLYKCRTTSSASIVKILKRVYNQPKINVLLNRSNLISYSKKAKKVWMRFFK
jgi:hypothetical protein